MNVRSLNGLRFILISALLVFMLIASRGILGSIYQLASGVSWVVGIAVLILVSIFVTWLGLRFANSYGEDQNSVTK